MGIPCLGTKAGLSSEKGQNSAMTASGSSIDRAFAERTLDEAGQFAVFLDAQRAILRATLDGMIDDEVRLRLVPSKTTLLGLIKHATFLQVVCGGE